MSGTPPHHSAASGPWRHRLGGAVGAGRWRGDIMRLWAGMLGGLPLLSKIRSQPVHLWCLPSCLHVKPEKQRVSFRLVPYGSCSHLSDTPEYIAPQPHKGERNRGHFTTTKDASPLAPNRVLQQTASSKDKKDCQHLRDFCSWHGFPTTRAPVYQQVQ